MLATACTPLDSVGMADLERLACWRVVGPVRVGLFLSVDAIPHRGDFAKDEKTSVGVDRERRVEQRAEQWNLVDLIIAHTWHAHCTHSEGRLITRAGWP
jgi:hypothetical protein